MDEFGGKFKVGVDVVDEDVENSKIYYENYEFIQIFFFMTKETY